MTKGQESLLELTISTLITRETIPIEHFREILNNIQKDLDVLEIIKNKKVDLIQFSISKNVESYNKTIMLSSNYKGISRFSLTLEEFNEIKEWLEK